MEQNSLQQKNTDITDQPIADVGKTTWSLLFGKYRLQTIAFISVSFIFLCSAVVIGVMSQGSKSMDNAAEFCFYLGIAIPIIWYTYINGRVEKEFMEQFARAHGYSYQVDGSSDGLHAALFLTGHSHVMYNVIAGTYLDCPLRLFNYQYVIDAGKSERTYSHTVFELTMNTDLTDMVLIHGKDSVWNNDNPHLSKQKQLTLEGDFSKYFTLYVMPGHETEALEIFTPDFMQDMIDRNKNFQIEFVDNHIYVYGDWIISTEKGLFDLYTTAQYLVGKLRNRVKDIHKNA